MDKDLYKILGIDRGASESDIKSAYKKLALKWHPDKFSSKSDKEKKEAEEKFKEINEAYQVLSDPQKKQQYDTFGTIDGSGGMGGGGFNPMDDPFFSSFFGGGNPFGQQRRSNMPQRGRDVSIRIEVTIAEVMKGAKKTVSYSIEKECPECHGDGGKDKKVCPHCNGTGMETKVTRTAFGYSQVSRPCSHCNGTGYTIGERCSRCNGTGVVQEIKTIEVTIPKGMRNGESQIFRGMGYYGHAGNGDLEVVFTYKYDEKRFSVSNYGKIYELIDVDWYDCILGAKMKHTLPDGTVVEVTIPKYASDGTNVTLKGKGLNGNDYIFVVKPKLPTSISDKEKKLIEEVKHLH